VLISALIGLEEDLELVGEAEPDVLLLDLAMPRLDGYAVLAQLEPNGHGARVVVYSSSPEASSERAARELGAVDYLVKGVSPTAVIEAIRRAARPRDD
jgi:CheY-like chemotaxis protein